MVIVGWLACPTTIACAANHRWAASTSSSAVSSRLSSSVLFHMTTVGCPSSALIRSTRSSCDPKGGRMNGVRMPKVLWIQSRLRPISSATSSSGSVVRSGWDQVWLPIATCPESTSGCSRSPFSSQEE